MVAGRFDCPTREVCVVLVLCGEMAAAGEVVEKGCDREGRLLDIDLRALEPGRIAAFIAMMSGARRARIKTESKQQYKEVRRESVIRAQDTHHSGRQLFVGSVLVGFADENWRELVGR